MRSSEFRKASRFLIVLGITASFLSGCAKTGQADQAQLEDTISVATSALQIATLATQIAGGGGGAGSIPTPAPAPIRQQAAATGKASSNGYSQRGAFEDCEKMYSAAGMAAQAADCKARAERMGSIR